MRQVKSTLQQNHDRTKKGKKLIILVFYHQLQNKKKNENQLMADEETPEDSSNTSDRFSKEALVPTLSPRHWTICYNSRKSKGRIVVCAGIKHTTMVPSGQIKVFRCWWLKNQQAVKRCVCMFFWWWRAEKGKVPVCEEGGRRRPFSLWPSLWPRPASPYLLRHWEWGYPVVTQRTENCRLKSSSWTLHPTGEKEKDLVFLCVSKVPSGERGDVGLVALCNNQIRLLMFDNWVFTPPQFLFVFWPTFWQSSKNSQGIKEREIEPDIPNLNHWN